MANWISNSRNPNSTDVDITNGTTDVVIATLCLAGSDIAHTSWERTAMQFIAAQDQTIIGRGLIFFDVSELGWTNIGFDAQHNFMLTVLDRAMSHHGWELLPYTPNSDILGDVLARIKRLIIEFQPQHCTNDRIEWPLIPPPSFERCKPHGVLMHLRGCPICNGN